jgi:hypothetical protein
MTGVDGEGAWVRGQEPAYLLDSTCGGEVHCFESLRSSDLEMILVRRGWWSLGHLSGTIRGREGFMRSQVPNAGPGVPSHVLDSQTWATRRSMHHWSSSP